MKYGCTPINVTRLGEYVFDRELPEDDAEDRYRQADIDQDHSDEQFDRMDRQNELR
jgi:hypothetical protein